MERLIGPLRADIARGEGEKFTTTALLVHGLWATEKVWRGFAGYLSHRGWSSYAVRLRGRDGLGIADVREHAADLAAALAALPAPPVIIGHDLGGLLALHLAERASAVVALAPLVPRPLGEPAALKAAGNRWTRWRRQPFSRPSRDAYPDGDVREAADVVRQLEEVEWPPAPAPAHAPCLVLASATDPVIDADATRRLAARAGTELDLLPSGGHALLTDPGWEERASRVHRWLVKHLGVSLLALYEESQQE